MKISELMAELSRKMDEGGDMQVVLPMDTGQYGMVTSMTVVPMFLHDAFEPVYDPRPLARQSKNEHEHVVVLSWDQ